MSKFLISKLSVLAIFVSLACLLGSFGIAVAAESEGAEFQDKSATSGAQEIELQDETVASVTPEEDLGVAGATTSLDSEGSNSADAGEPNDPDTVNPQDVVVPGSSDPNQNADGNGSRPDGSLPDENGTDSESSAQPPTFQPNDGLVQQDGGIYFYRNGQPVSGEQKVGNSWYYFDPNTHRAATSQFVLVPDATQPSGLKWIYCNSNGVRLAGEQYLQGHWYYFNPQSGAVTYGFVLLDDPAVEGGQKWVYYGPEMADGTMRYGEQCIDGKWYYLTPGSGAVDYEWALIPTNDGGAKWVYYGPFMADGTMRYGNQQINGRPYYFDEYTGEVLSKSQLIGRLLAAAYSEVGTPDSQTGKYIRWVNDNGGDWCDKGPCMSFVSYCFGKANLRPFLMDESLTGWPHKALDWYRANGDVDLNPTPGSIVFFQHGGWSEGLSAGHAGLIVSNEGNGYFTTIEAISGGTQLVHRNLFYNGYTGIVAGIAHPPFDFVF